MSLKKPAIILMTPVNAVNATGTFTYLGTVLGHQTLTIGTEIYESDTGETGVTTGNIAFATGATGTSATSVVTMLVSAITNSSVLYTAVTGASGRILTVENIIAGTIGNVHCTQTLTGSWTATSLAGGTDGTICAKGSLFVDASYLYVAKTSNTVSCKNIFAVTGVVV